ncbi:hypothetical protein [Chryseobacterium sp. JUb7]|uniref:hypothetical protein n=1 Tax=Chryseobacterium sp. JUb7 TaxID=2940599 RepID=UPI002168C263|nr:hypothetical protein [Chryseobacterium sp. JUb7]MCS3532440.1 hypothetical protein [Chryseobacterium sp. JUb7]
MKKFLFKISFYLLGLVIIFAVLGSFADGNTDDNYMHFAVEKPNNIILGDSRGSQAVLPRILKEKLQRKFDNFSLNVVQSPYGPVYLDALKKKIHENTKNGIFILTVDPWNLSSNKGVEKFKDFPEEHSPLKNMHFYNWSPNYEYLLKNYSRSWFKIYTEREKVGKSNTYLHKDGWLEVTVDMQKDSVKKRETEKVDFFYKDLAVNQKISSTRLRSLEDIIKFLKNKGTVYLVRIPTSERLMKVENSYAPDFNLKMKEIAEKHQMQYFDFTSNPNDYQYTDGNHMYKESGKVFTAQLADSILIKRKDLK